MSSDQVENVPLAIADGEQIPDHIGIYERFEQIDFLNDSSVEIVDAIDDYADTIRQELAYILDIIPDSKSVMKLYEVAEDELNIGRAELEGDEDVKALVKASKAGNISDEELYQHPKIQQLEQLRKRATLRRNLIDFMTDADSERETSRNFIELTLWYTTNKTAKLKPNSRRLLQRAIEDANVDTTEGPRRRKLVAWMDRLTRVANDQIHSEETEDTSLPEEKAS